MAAELFTVPFQCVVVNGLAVPGATLTFYNTNSTDKLPIWTSAAMTTPRTNPVVANGSGAIPPTYLDTAYTYRLVIKNRAGTVVDGGDIDPYIPGITTLGITLTSAAGAGVNSKGALAALSAPTNGQPAFLTLDGAEGMFVAEDYAAVSTEVTADTEQGRYVRSVSDASKVWARPVTKTKYPGDFNAVGDGTNQDVELQAMLDSGGEIFIPPLHYHSASDLIIRKLVAISGVNYGFDNRIVDGSATLGYENQPGSRISFAAGADGFDIQPQTTVTDPAGDLTAIQEGAFQSRISNLALIGAGTGAPTTGLHSRTVVHLDNVHCYKFTGKGFDISATTVIGDTAAEYGSASGSTLTKCKAISNGSHGFHIRGGDANVIKVGACNGSSNGGWGFLDDGLYGNGYGVCHAAANSSGSYSNGTIWTGRHTYTDCYVEADAGIACYLGPQCVIVGGMLAEFAVNNNTFPGEQALIIAAGKLYNASFKGNLLVENADTATKNILQLDSPVPIGEGNGIVWQSGAAEFARVGCVYDGGGNYYLTFGHLYTGGANNSNEIMRLSIPGLNLATGKTISIGGIQVVGPQGAAVTPPAGGATIDAEARTAIAALISRLQAAGTIA